LDGQQSNRPKVDPAPPLERHDLAPEPTPEPTVVDVLEGVTDALDAAVAASEPRLTTARASLVLARMKAASAGYLDADELLATLALQAQEWRSS